MAEKSLTFSSDHFHVTDFIHFCSVKTSEHLTWEFPNYVR